ncbi:hypothetical protein OJJOAM_003668 [Cupriavidus sp. H18C1]
MLERIAGLEPGVQHAVGEHVIRHLAAQDRERGQAVELPQTFDDDRVVARAVFAQPGQQARVIGVDAPGRPQRDHVELALAHPWRIGIVAADDIDVHAALDQRHAQLPQPFDRAAAGRIDCRNDVKKLHGPDRIGMQQDGMAHSDRTCRAKTRRAGGRRSVPQSVGSAMGKLCSLAHPADVPPAWPARGSIPSARTAAEGWKQGGSGAETGWRRGRRALPCGHHPDGGEPAHPFGGYPFRGASSVCAARSTTGHAGAVSALYRGAAPAVYYCDASAIGDGTSFNVETLSRARCFIIETLMRAFILTHLGRLETLMDQGLPDYEKWG